VLAVGEQNLLSVADRDDDGEIDAPVVAAALAQASEMVSSYLSDYMANFVMVPSVTRATVDIAFELLHVGKQSTEDSRLNYKRAVQWLSDISTGKAVLPGQPKTDDGVIDPGDPLVMSGDRNWNRQNASRLF